MKQPYLAAIAAALLLGGCTTVVYPPQQPMVEEYRPPLIVSPQGPAVLYGNPRIPYWATPQYPHRHHYDRW